MQPGGGHGRIPAISSPPPSSSSAFAPASISSGFEPIQQQAILPRDFPHSQSGIRPMQPPQAVAQNTVSNLQALQAWAQQRNIDLSKPANLRLMNQIVPLMQSSPRTSSLPIQNEANTLAQQPSSRSTNVLSSIENGASSRQMAQPSVEQFHASTTIAGTELPQSQQSRPLTKQHPRGIFTKQQQFTLKAQILAFRRIKNGEALPKEILSAITASPLDSCIQPVNASSNLIRQEISHHNHINEKEKHVATSQQPSLLPPSTGQCSALTNPVPREEKPVTAINLSKDNGIITSKDQGGSMVKPSPKEIPMRKFHGPLFDFPCFSRRADSMGSSPTNYSLSLSYDLKDLLHEEGVSVLNTKRIESLKKITGILDENRIKPDLMLRLQIEEKKLRLFGYWSNLKDELDKEQKEIMAMSERQYRMFVRQCERERVELVRQVHQVKKQFRDKQLKALFTWRKKLLEAHWAVRDARTTRNRGVAKYHERMLKESSKRKDGDRDRRMDALKNNDVDRYKEMLLEQQKTSVPGDAAQRFAILTSFLSQTEDYLRKLGGKITASKTSQEAEEAANAAARTARAQGLSEDEVKAAAACARKEAMIRYNFTEINAPNENSSTVNKYYNLAHAVTERVSKQPSRLQAGILRDYQLVGLQWMLSLYNNKLNGILADEMGLGKTVQVMALIAYLMEFKGNFGPHLIIVPNAVLVNWKSELLSWLPSVKCLYYVGTKDQRNRMFSNEVHPLKFNILVTTYEFVMKDRPKLSRVNWNYIIIDEAQRMKDRDSVLARDLDRYNCERRLLLTGTPLQNDLKELWSLLNLLLPQVFDNGKTFRDWFSQPFQKDGSSQNNVEEDDWLETEKKVIIIHRLHQILEPFMLRRRVEDVEGSIPLKVPIVLRCRMSAIQGAIYDWIKSTGTIRVDPEEEERKHKKNPNYQPKMYKNVTNRCVELRKLCNHPLLNYPYFNDYSRDFVVRSCGKLWVLDRILLKLQRTGHRVLLFSTMTKLLDIVEEYLQWRRLVYLRIDGSTNLEERESAIVDFNSPDSDSFIFLLSIRAAGRGLNLQSADTVVIYDPDVNPQNEEQAVARAHRIGQTREVKVIYLESVVDKISSFEKEDELRNGGTELDSDDDEFVGKDRYMGSVESLIRNNIQQYKIEMADEVINAGKFDQITTHEERRINLESLLHDEEKNQAIVHDVPSLQQINRMIARSDEEVELFDQMDEEFDWTMDMVKHNQVPQWLRAGSREVNAIVSKLSKKSSKNVLVSNSTLNSITSERRGRAKGSYGKRSVYVESSDEEDEGKSDSSSDDMEEYEDDDSNNKALVEDDEDEEFVNWNDDSEDQIKKPPQIKRKRTLRGRPKRTVSRVEHRSVRQKRSYKPINRDVHSPISMDMSESLQRKCKNIIAKFKRRIDKDGHQIVPILFDLWKKNKNSNFSSKSTMSTNLLDLHRIEEQLDGHEYNEVSEFVTDVQIMLESVVQYSSYSHEVAKEARTLQDIFFETLESTFPNEDYPRRQIPVMDRTNQVGSSKSPLESSLSHPGELVFCRRKRKDREKQRVCPPSPMSSQSPLIGPSSSPCLHDVQWAKPVKRIRSDTGKRRHS